MTEQHIGPTWFFGEKIIPGGTKKPWWMNRQLAHPCADLAWPFEVGTRAAQAGR